MSVLVKFSGCKIVHKFIELVEEELGPANFCNMDCLDEED